MKKRLLSALLSMGLAFSALPSFASFDITYAKNATLGGGAAFENESAVMAKPYCYAMFENVDLTGAKSIFISAKCSLSGYGDGDKIQVRIDSDKGKLLGYVAIGEHTPNTEKEFGGALESVSGTHDIYLVASMGSEDKNTVSISSFRLSGSEYTNGKYSPVDDEDIADMKYTTLSATDSLGRKVAGYSEAGPLKEDKYVGLFYWTWHSAWEGHTVVVNNTEFAKLHPDAKYDYNNEAWPYSAAYFWNEPLFGYYGGSDYWVYRKHAEMLALAGVDVIFFDCTNGAHSYRKAYETLFNAFHDAREDGVMTPKIAFAGPMSYSSNNSYVNSSNKEAVKRIYLGAYSDKKWTDLWFYWEGKPFILAYDEMLEGREDDDEDSALMQEIRGFFTFRGLTGEFDKKQFRDNQWSWLEIYPQNGYTPTKDGGFEEVSIGAAVNYDYETRKLTAMNAEHSMGRSYTALLGDDESEDSDLYGYFFTEQLNHALTVDAKMLFVDGWNEWNAGRYASWGGVTNAFPDTYDDESSRDLEPTKGRLKDNYYMLLCDAARKWKGALPVETAGSDKTINITDFSSWAGVTPEYLSPKGTYNRNATGYGKTEFINNTKRNVVTKSLATKDANYMYFYAECENTITDAEGDKWMKLYIDSDRNHATGWEGYDFVINYPSPGDVSAYNGEYEKIGTAEYFVSGNELALKIEKELINTSEFEFKWADNVSGDIMDYYSYGHTSPMGRFNYVYTKEKEVYKGDDRLAGTAIVKPGENYAYYSGKKVYVYEPDTRRKVICANGEAYIPAYFLNDAFSIRTKYDNGVLSLSGEKQTSTSPGERKAYIGTEEITLKNPVIIVENVPYVPVSYLNTVFGYSVKRINGIIAVGTDIDEEAVSAFEFSESGKAMIGETEYATLSDAVTAVRDGETIRLTGNMESEIFMMEQKKTFTIDGGGNTVIFSGNGTIWFNSTVTLKNVTFTADAESYGSAEGFIRINGGALILDNDAVIEGTGTVMGGAVKLTGGELILNSETAAIRNTYATWAGGGVCIQGGRMKMLSGTIENASAGDGGAANGGGGAVYVAGGELILAGGEIKNSYNSKGAVYATGGKITLTNDVRITDNGGKNICLKDENILFLTGGFSGSVNVSLENSGTASDDTVFGSADTNAFGAGRIRLEGDAEVGGYIKNGKLYFNAKKQNAVLSIRSDSGVYDDGTGIIRYITTFDELKFPEKVVSFGVWIIPMEAFSDETFENTRTEILINKNDPDINSGMILANESFHADISDIPAVKLDEKILTVSFVNFSDGTVITAEYVSDGVNRENRLKRIYDGKLKTSVIGGREISY